MNYLEVDGSQTSTNNEGVALVNGSISFQEVRLEEDLEPVSGQPFDGVVDRQDVNSLAILDVRAFCHGDDVAQTNPEVISDNAVHADLLVGHRVVAEHDADGLLSLLAFEQDGVAAEEPELVHLGLREGDYGVVVIGRLFDDQPVGSGLLVEDGRGQGLTLGAVFFAFSRHFVTKFGFSREKVTNPD